MDQLVNLFMANYGMSSDEAKRQALFYMNRPTDTMTRYFMKQAADHAQAATPPSGMGQALPAPTPGSSAPGAIVLPVGGKPQTVTVADIANGAPPSMAELGLVPQTQPKVYGGAKTAPRDFASGQVSPPKRTMVNSGY